MPFDNKLSFFVVPIWKRRRKILVPAFSPKIVETFVEIFSQQSEKMAKKLSNRVDKGKFQIWPFISTYTLDSVCGKFYKFYKIKKLNLNILSLFFLILPNKTIKVKSVHWLSYLFIFYVFLL